MLGRLSRWLRLLGYDAAYWRDGSDEELMAAARAEGRLIVTRDRALAGRRGLRALLVAAESLDEQIAEVQAALGGHPEPFTRCPECNGALADLPHAARARSGATLRLAHPVAVPPLPRLRPGLLERHTLANHDGQAGAREPMTQSSPAAPHWIAHRSTFDATPSLRWSWAWAASSSMPLRPRHRWRRCSTTAWNSTSSCRPWASRTPVAIRSTRWLASYSRCSSPSGTPPGEPISCPHSARGPQ